MDYYTHFTWLYLLKNKFDVFLTFTQFKAIVKTQFSSKIQTSNGGGEYTSSAFKNFFTLNSIIHQISCPYTPQQNGLVKRKHRHIVETTITLFSHAKLPYSFRSYAVSIATYLINPFTYFHSSLTIPLVLSLWSHPKLVSTLNIWLQLLSLLKAL